MRVRVLPTYWMLLSLFLGFAVVMGLRRPRPLVLSPLPLRLCDIPVSLPDGTIRCLAPVEAENWNVGPGDVVPLSPDGVRLPGPPARLSGQKQLALGLKLDPNLATQADLEALPDVGPALAQAIIATRQRRRIQTATDLLTVRGLGPKRLAKLRPYLQLLETR